MVDKNNNNDDLWLDEDTPSPEASQSRRDVLRVVAMGHFDRTRSQVYGTGNKWAIENFNATHY